MLAVTTELKLQRSSLTQFTRSAAPQWDRAAKLCARGSNRKKLPQQWKTEQLPRWLAWRFPSATLESGRQRRSRELRITRPRSRQPGSASRILREIAAEWLAPWLRRRREHQFRGCVP